MRTNLLQRLSLARAFAEPCSPAARGGEAARGGDTFLPKFFWRNRERTQSFAELGPTRSKLGEKTFLNRKENPGTGGIGRRFKLGIASFPPGA
jgi:hypothetical protein